MDSQLRQLKRATLSNPDDVEALHRYVAALERVVGGAELDSYTGRRGWKCPDPEVDEHNSIAGSPDGVCVYFSELRLDERRTVALIIDGEEVDWLLPESYQSERESEDWCIFCGEPSERK